MPKPTLGDELKRLMERKPKVEVTKLPEKEPEFKPGKGYSEKTEWPTHLHVTSEKYPWIAKQKAGDEVYLIVRAKVGEIVTVEKEKGKPETSSSLTLLEVGKWGAGRP